MLSLILSSPQAIMFRKVKHPYTEYHQCTSEMVLEMISDLEIKDGELVFHLLGLNLDLIYFVYHFAFLLFAYYLPLFCILISYAFIFYIVKRWQLIFFLSDYFWQKSILFRRELSISSVQVKTNRYRLMRNQWKNLRMSFLQVIFFAVFWAPYVAQQTW